VITGQRDGGGTGHQMSSQSGVGGGDHRENNTVPYWQDEKCKERRRMK